MKNIGRPYWSNNKRQQDGCTSIEPCSRPGSCADNCISFVTVDVPDTIIPIHTQFAINERILREDHAHA